MKFLYSKIHGGIKLLKSELSQDRLVILGKRFRNTHY